MKLLVVDAWYRLTILGACEHSWMCEVARVIYGLMTACRVFAT